MNQYFFMLNLYCVVLPFFNELNFTLMKYQTEMPDEKLIQFYLSNNPTALVTLTDLYKDRIYHVIYSTVKDKYAAEEIFRNVFVRIINNLMTGKNAEDGNFMEWTKQLAQQLCIEYNCKAHQGLMPGNICHTAEVPLQLQETLPEKTYYDSHTKLRTMISMLPDNQREVIILNHYAGMSFRDIATRMKCSVTTALEIMKTGLNNLRKLMTEHEVLLQ